MIAFSSVCVKELFAFLNISTCRHHKTLQRVVIAPVCIFLKCRIEHICKWNLGIRLLTINFNPKITTSYKHFGLLKLPQTIFFSKTRYFLAYFFIVIFHFFNFVFHILQKWASFEIWKFILIKEYRKVLHTWLHLKVIVEDGVLAEAYLLQVVNSHCCHGGLIQSRLLPGSTWNKFFLRHDLAERWLLGFG